MPEILSGTELKNKTFPPVNWLVEKLLPTGVALLVGKPKLGKSWLALNLSHSVASGTLALGALKTKQANTLYISLEDSPRRLQSRLQHVELPNTLSFAFSWAKGDKAIVDLEQIVKLHHFQLVVIDPLALIKQQTKPNRDLYMLDYSLISAYKKLAESLDISVIILHHTRKAQADDPIDTILGTTGLSGATDTILVLDRPRQKINATLTVTGRDVPENEFILTKDELLGWRLVGESDKWQMSAERAEIYQLLLEKNKPMTLSEIIKLTDKPSSSVKMMLARMVQDRQIARIERGRYKITT